MAYSSGFFNSVDHDRMYDAEDVGSLFDGIISDGILNAWGAHFETRHDDNFGPLEVKVFSGRGWFLHTWIQNGGPVSLTAETNRTGNVRIDTVCLDINTSDSVRANTIKIKTGSTHAPDMANDGNHKEVPLADITISTSNVITSVTDRRSENYAQCMFALPYYPVGSIYMSVNNDEPSGLFGGTWQPIKGRFLVGCGDNSGFTPSEIGGSWTHTLSMDQMPRHSHNINNVPTSSEIADVHVKNINAPSDLEDTAIMGWADNSSASPSSNNTTQNYLPADWNFPYGYNGSNIPDPEGGLNIAPSKYLTNQSMLSQNTHMHYANGSTQDSGSGAEITIKPPYMAVYMWVRTG